MAPVRAQISDLAARPRPTTIAGVRLLSAGRTGDGLLLVREEAAMASPIERRSRCCLGWTLPARRRCAPQPAGSFIGKLGPDAARFRRLSPLPSAILRTLPAVRAGKELAAVPHLGYICDTSWARMTLLFSPRNPLAGSLLYDPGDYAAVFRREGDDFSGIVGHAEQVGMKVANLHTMLAVSCWALCSGREHDTPLYGLRT